MLCWSLWPLDSVVRSACGDDDGDAEQDPLGVVEAAYESFNDGDVDVWVEIRDRGSAYPSEEDRAEVLAAMRTEVEDMTQNGWQYVDVACESQGEGEWPVADEGNVSGTYVACDTTLVSDDGTTQYGEAFEWVVHDGEVVAVTSNR